MISTYTNISIYNNYKHSQQRALNMFSCFAMHSMNRHINIKSNEIEISREMNFIEVDN